MGAVRRGRTGGTRGAWAGGMADRATWSVGAGGDPEKGFDRTDLFERADEALYRAKELGKAQTHVAANGA